MKSYVITTSVKKRLLIAVTFLSIIALVYKRPKGEIPTSLFHSIAKRKADGNVYNYSNMVKENIQKQRNRTLPKENPDARPFVRMKSWYRIAPEYKLSGCIVEKSMCTIIQGIFCYLFDTDEFVAAGKSITTEEWEKRFCLFRNEPPTTQLKNKLMPYPTETIFVARDPLQRFLSGFVDKCIHERSRCYGCEGNVLCTIERLHAELLRLSFQFYLIQSKRREMIPVSYEAQHMAPQTWYCDLFDESSSYVFLRYGEKGMDHERMVNDLNTVFKDHGVEEQKREYVEQSLWKNTQHTTKYSPVRESLAEQIRNSQKHLKLLWQMYRYDYEIFGFKSPINVF